MYGTLPEDPVPSSSDATELPLSVPSVTGVGPAVMPLLKLNVGEFSAEGYSRWISPRKPNFRLWLFSAWEKFTCRPSVSCGVLFWLLRPSVV